MARLAIVAIAGILAQHEDDLRRLAIVAIVAILAQQEFKWPFLGPWQLQCSLTQSQGGWEFKWLLFRPVPGNINSNIQYDVGLTLGII